MSDTYILNDDHSIRKAELHEWAEWMEEADRRVKLTTTRYHDISTVFIGVDYRFMVEELPLPLVFETMVFGRDIHPDFGGRTEMEHEMDRYCTWDQAVKGHHAMVKRVLKFEAERILSYG